MAMGVVGQRDTTFRVDWSFTLPDGSRFSELHWRMLRDASKHVTPNAGWPEAASAGALDLVLLGPRRYAGGDAKTDWLGDGRARATTADIRRMVALFGVACFLAAGLVALIGLLIQAR